MGRWGRGFSNGEQDAPTTLFLTVYCSLLTRHLRKRKKNCIQTSPPLGERLKNPHSLVGKGGRGVRYVCNLEPDT